MDTGWLASQLVIGFVVVVLVVGGLAFFAFVEPRKADPAGGAGGRMGGPHEHAQGAAGAGDPETSAIGGPGIEPPVADGAGAPGAGAPGNGGQAAASVFETEPCWRSLLQGGRSPAGSVAGGSAAASFPSAHDGIATAGRAGRHV